MNKPNRERKEVFKNSNTVVLGIPGYGIHYHPKNMNSQNNSKDVVVVSNSEKDR